jgi:hypothetical protein
MVRTKAVLQYTDIQTDRQAGRQAGRQANRQTDIPKLINLSFPVDTGTLSGVLHGFSSFLHHDRIQW